MTDPLQQQIVEFIDTYTRTHPYCPSIREIAEGVGRGTSTLMWHLPRMREEGLIDYLPNQPRTYHIPRKGTP